MGGEGEELGGGEAKREVLAIELLRTRKPLSDVCP